MNYKFEDETEILKFIRDILIQGDSRYLDTEREKPYQNLLSIMQFPLKREKYLIEAS